jgi:hypothetical protein
MEWAATCSGWVRKEASDASDLTHAMDELRILPFGSAAPRRFHQITARRFRSPQGGIGTA